MRLADIDALQNRPQRLRVKVAGELAALCHRNDACFLGDNQHNRVRRFGHADSGAVARAEVMADAAGFRPQKNQTCGYGQRG